MAGWGGIPFCARPIRGLVGSLPSDEGKQKTEKEVRK